LDDDGEIDRALLEVLGDDLAGMGGDVPHDAAQPCQSFRKLWHDAEPPRFDDLDEWEGWQ
jgi:hypothetical protein